MLTGTTRACRSCTRLLGLLGVGVLGLAVPSAFAQHPDGLAPSHVRHVVVTFPQGVSLSPSAAQGLRACGDAQLGLRSDAPETCPDASNIGTVEIQTPMLEGTLKGAVYVRPPTRDAMFRLALTAYGRGVRIKLPGVVHLDPGTGQVSARFRELPQLPFSEIALRFFGGQRAVLANPPRCGAYATRGVFTPWSGTPPIHQAAPFAIGSPGPACSRPLPFRPAVSAGSVNPVARAAAPLVVRVQRRPGDQELERITAAFPPGVSAALRTVTPCAVARARTGGCPEASRIGTATIGAGPGAWPLYLQGKVFLTESYGGGRFGLSIAVPAVAGPFDLGTVVVRAAVDVDPTTARLTVRSDPLPRILRGVVLRLRDIHLAIDRPGFARNPTNCGRKGIGVTVEGGDGATSSQTVPFRVGDCSALRFRPRFSVALVGRRMIPDARVGLRVRVRARARDANLRRVAFTLPPQIAFDALRRGPRLCSRARLDARSCPKGSKVGTARATSPLLARPLKGPVYFIRGVRGDPFPKLAMLLDGELRIDLLGSTAVRHNGLRTTFGTLPDVPIAAFELRLERGMLTPTRHLCRRRLRARLEMTAQNGRRSDRSVPIRVPCKG